MSPVSKKRKPKVSKYAKARHAVRDAEKKVRDFEAFAERLRVRAIQIGEFASATAKRCLELESNFRKARGLVFDTWGDSSDVIGFMDEQIADFFPQSASLPPAEAEASDVVNPLSDINPALADGILELGAGNGPDPDGPEGSASVTHVILSRALIIVFRVLAGHHVLVEDVTGIAAFEIRCTKDVLLAQTIAPQPTVSEVHNAAAVFAHVGYQTIIGSDQHPYVSVAAVSDTEDVMCDVRISLGTEEDPE